MINEIIKFKEVRSTQDAARRLVGKKKELAVIALSQKMGRGRHGRHWYSPSGGLYVSLVLFPKSRPETLPLLACLAVIKTLEQYGCSQASILWPNDVLVDQRKICGILSEQYKSAYICGIGLNVNIEEFSGTEPNATSMLLDRKQKFDLESVAVSLIDKFNTLYLEYAGQGLEIRQAYHYIGGIGEPVEIITSRNRETGIVHGIDDDWAILIRDEHGVIRRYRYGEVKKLRW